MIDRIFGLFGVYSKDEPSKKIHEPIPQEIENKLKEIGFDLEAFTGQFPFFKEEKGVFFFKSHKLEARNPNKEPLLYTMTKFVEFRPNGDIVVQVVQEFEPDTYPQNPKNRTTTITHQPKKEQHDDKTNIEMTTTFGDGSVLSTTILKTGDNPSGVVITNLIDNKGVNINNPTPLQIQKNAYAPEPNSVSLWQGMSHYGLLKMVAMQGHVDLKFKNNSLSYTAN